MNPVVDATSDTRSEGTGDIVAAGQFTPDGAVCTVAGLIVEVGRTHDRHGITAGTVRTISSSSERVITSSSPAFRRSAM